MLIICLIISLTVIIYSIMEWCEYGFFKKQLILILIAVVISIVCILAIIAERKAKVYQAFKVNQTKIVELKYDS